MDSRYKTEEQARFIGMMNELIAAHGHNKSSIAELCGISPSMITAIVSGDRNPRLALDRLQTEYDKITKPPGSGTQPSEVLSSDGLHEKLNELKHKDPTAYEQAKSSIEFLHERASRSPDEVASEAAKRAVHDVKHPGVVYGRRRRKANFDAQAEAGHLAQKLSRGVVGPSDAKQKPKPPTNRPPHTVEPRSTSGTHAKPSHKP